MKRDYFTELSELAATYSECLRAPLEDAIDALGWRGPAVFVGSGGALAAARLAADLHVEQFGSPALATTPLHAATTPYSSSVGLVLFTARGKHPDSAMAVRAARFRGAAHIAIVSAQRREDLPPDLSAGDTFVATVPTPRDGFLATNSVLAMATIACLAHRAELPDVLPAFDNASLRPVRRSVLIVVGPGLSAVGHDLEARLAETGIADAQVTDFRNLAHGRHVGLLRRSDETTVVAVSDLTSQALAERTLGLLPPTIDVCRLESTQPQPASALDLLVQSMRLAGEIGVSQGVDPGRPGVAEFGRRLYHLPTTRLVKPTIPTPVDRKIREAVGVSQDAAEVALKRWVAETAAADLRGVVLDYDGTCCPTWDRFRPPPVEVQRALTRLLENGLWIGFASGRGQSLHADTRSWLPERLWERVTVGLYNGTYLVRLSDELEDWTDCVGSLATAADRLENDPLAASWAIERRRTQVSVSGLAGRGIGEQFLPMVRAVLGRPPTLPCKALASGHSVDIVLTEAGKTAVVDAVRELTGGAVLSIGDQGQADGNDFELLAAVPTSLSVDRCSPDLTRCWNLDMRGERGPHLLIQYLAAIDIDGGVGHFRWQNR